MRTRAADRGRQPRREVSATAAGRRALRRWLSRAPDRAALDPPPDSLRIRLYFVGLLSRAEQERFFDETRAGLEERLAAFQAYAAGYADEGPERISRIAARGGVHATRARIRWLDEAREALLGGKE